MQNKYTFKFGGTKMSCGCSNLGNDGKAVVDLVRSKGKADLKLRNAYEINCSCGQTFTMEILVSLILRCCSRTPWKHHDV